MTHRLLSRSACSPCVHTNRSCGGSPGRHSFHAPPGKGLKPPSGVASPTEGVGTSVQRGKLPKSLPFGDTAALVIMTVPDEATEIRSMCSPVTTNVWPWAFSSGMWPTRLSALQARSSLGWKQSRNLPAQRRQLRRDDLPDDVEIYAKVSVDHAVSCSDNLLPRDLGVG